MLVMLVATVMLVAGALSYFAVAADVEPCGPVTQTQCPSCGANTYIPDQLLYVRVANKKHTYNGNCTCEYVITTTVYGYRCGTCGLENATRSDSSETGHSCK